MPFFEPALTVIPFVSRVDPEVSILPPSPSTAYASKVPLADVFDLEFFISDQTTILPPSPLPVELASIKVFFSTVVNVA